MERSNENLFGEKFALDVARSEEGRMGTETTSNRSPVREDRFEIRVNNHSHGLQVGYLA